MKHVIVLSLFISAALVITGCETSSLPTASEDGAAELAAPALGKGGPPADNGAVGAHKKTTGGVAWMGGGVERNASFAAHDIAPGSERDRGHVTYWFEDGSFKADVNCVNVDADIALFGATITKADGVYATNVGDELLVRVEDGGTPGREGDTFRAVFDEAACAKVEAGTPPPGPYFAVTQGNLVVHN